MVLVDGGCARVALCEPDHGVEIRARAEFATARQHNYLRTANTNDQFVNTLLSAVYH